MLNYDTQLFPHHLDPQRPYDFSQPIASVNQHPQHPNILWSLLPPMNQILTHGFMGKYGDKTPMKCVFCGGELQKDSVTFSYEDNEIYILVEKELSMHKSAPRQDENS